MSTSQVVTYLTEYGDGGYGTLAYPAPVDQSVETTTVNRALIPLPPPVFTGMKLQSDVIIGDLILNRIDSNNVIWVCTEIDGWWVHPDPDVPDVPRGWRDGSYDARGRWQARQITLNGVILPPDPSYLPAARNELIAKTSLVYTGAWLRTEESPAKVSWVRLSGRPEISTVNARGRTEFSIGLRAADPIKYSWNDSDPDGYDSVAIPCKNTSTPEDGEATVTNAGNTTVTTFIEITGPIVAPATVYNEATDELLTVIEPLRGSETRTVTQKQLTGNVATLTFSGTHTMVEGDIVTVSGVDGIFDGTYEVSNVPTTSKISYAKTANNVGLIASGGAVVRDADFLEIDTYEREVALNGVKTGARTTIDTLVDWITLAPGANNIRFEDEGDSTSDASLTVYYRSGWLG